MRALVVAAGLGVLVILWLYAPTVRDRLTRERRDAIQQHSNDRPEEVR